MAGDAGSGDVGADDTGSDNPGRVRVALDARAYDILAAPDLLDRAGALMAPILRRPQTVIVTDQTVADLYLSRLEASLDQAGIAHSAIILPPGESTKSFGHLNDVMDRLFDIPIERATSLIALGGGVIGDLTGFAAAVALRGIDFVQIPTTLLAQVDSSVGGKTAINVAAGKNLVGAFHQPRLVLADLSVLDTLPERELKSGYAEVVKYGLIGDRDFFEWLEGKGGSLLAGDMSARRHAVTESCEAKARIVAEDEREGGRRALLNLGHTFGHALESATGYGATLLHGEAVAIGMAMAFRLSTRMGLCPGQDTERTEAHLRSLGLATRLSDVPDVNWDAEDLIARMATDKKVADGKLTFILTRSIGDAFITRDVPRETLAAAMAEEITR